jgi:hypothetical protein
MLSSTTRDSGIPFGCQDTLSKPRPFGSIFNLGNNQKSWRGGGDTWWVGRMGNDNHVAVCHKFCGLQGSVGACTVVMKQPVQIFWCLCAHGLFGEGLHGWVLESFQHFLSFCWCLVTLYIWHIQLTLNWPCKTWMLFQTAVQLKECSPNALWNFSRVLLAYLWNFMQKLMHICCLPGWGLDARFQRDATDIALW